MDALFEEAQKAINRVKERSIGPETVTDLSTLLASAVKALRASEGTLQGLDSRLQTEQQHTANIHSQADARILSAIKERDAAVALERSHAQILALAVNLDDTLADLDDAQTQIAILTAQIAALAASHAAALSDADAAAKTIEAERDAALARDATHHDALTKIASLGVFQRLKAVPLAREAVHGPQ